MYAIKWTENGKYYTETAFTTVGLSLIVETLVSKASDGAPISDIDIEEIE